MIDNYFLKPIRCRTKIFGKIFNSESASDHKNGRLFAMRAMIRTLSFSLFPWQSYTEYLRRDGGRITRRLTLKYSKRFEYLISGISRTLEFGWTLLKIIRNLRRARQVSRLSIPFREILVTDRDLHCEEKKRSILSLFHFLSLFRFLLLLLLLFFFSLVNAPIERDG